MSTVNSCLIVGAGISGLLAARKLADAGIPVTVLEKAAGVGGRMATRRIDSGVADHGAQFITGQDPHFSAYLLQWQNLGIVSAWAPGFPDTEGRFPVAGHSRFRGAKGMTSVPKHLAAGLDVRLNQRALRVEPLDNTWKIVTDQNQSFAADALMLSLPVPQGLSLLEDVPNLLPGNIINELRHLSYHPTLCAVLLLGGPSKIPPPGALHVVDENVAWIADNRQKGISPDATTVTIHATHRFSSSSFDSPEDSVIGTMIAAVHDLIGAPVLKAQLHRWRYAEPANVSAVRALLAVSSPPLIFSGDAFGGPSVEGAALSGLAAAELLIGRQRNS